MEVTRKFSLLKDLGCWEDMCTQKVLCALQSPLLRRCKSDSAPLAAVEHLTALGFLRAVFVFRAFCPQLFGASAPPPWSVFCFAVLVVLPLLLCFSSTWWLWVAQVLCCRSPLLVFVCSCPGPSTCWGVFLSFSGCGWWLSFGAPGLLPAWGVRLLPLGYWVVAFAFVLWRLFFGALGLLLSLPLGGCGCRLSNDPLRLLLMVGVAFCASGRLLILLLVVLLSLSSSLHFSFSSSSRLSSSLSVCVLWSPSCFPCLVSGLPLCLA